MFCSIMVAERLLCGCREAQKRRATNYMLYFSHADLTLISRFGTAKFVVAFSVQLVMWLIYAGLLVYAAQTLVLKALQDLDNAPEIWADNYTSIGGEDASSLPFLLFDLLLFDLLLNLLHTRRPPPPPYDTSGCR